MRHLLIACLSFSAALLVPLAAGAQELQPTLDSASGVSFYELKHGDTIAKFAAGSGANLFSIRIDGTEYLWQPETLSKLAGVSCGVPILYPTPNRVKDATFTFDGKQVNFPANSGKNFIHGLVNKLAWRVVHTARGKDDSSIRCLASFSPDSDLARQFPFPHQLYLTITVSDRRIRWHYEVDNAAGTRPVPFGFALHPYFQYLGQRENTYLTIPATHWMESRAQLPTGRLIPAAELDYALGEAMSLAGTQFDDVFFGTEPQRKTRIEFQGVGKSIEIRGSDAFTHIVVWTPSRPFFGIESQTCSTDAHNLYAAGQQKAAHLQVCPAGQKMTGWVEYYFPAKPKQALGRAP